MCAEIARILGDLVEAVEGGEYEVADGSSWVRRRWVAEAVVLEVDRYSWPG